ncbi:MAG: hypothetical protein QG612_692 [Pseudomonadota bacterium]|nr:hypothetical protein [Pseudomonadota bacterium]
MRPWQPGGGGPWPEAGAGEGLPGPVQARLDAMAIVATSPLALHTPGVDGGYTQRDVQELARVFDARAAGWCEGKVGP